MMACVPPHDDRHNKKHFIGYSRLAACDLYRNRYGTFLQQTVVLMPSNKPSLVGFSTHYTSQITALTVRQSRKALCNRRPHARYSSIIALIDSSRGSWSKYVRRTAAVAAVPRIIGTTVCKTLSTRNY